MPTCMCISGVLEGGASQCRIYRGAHGARAPGLRKQGASADCLIINLFGMVALLCEQNTCSMYNINSNLQQLAAIKIRQILNE